jgi:hypothetical protein
MDLPGGTRASVLDPAGRGTEGFGRRCPPRQEEKLRLRNRRRRTARASALSGSPRGNRKRLRPRTDPGGSGTLVWSFGAWPFGALSFRISALVSAPRNSPTRDALLRQGRTRRDSGGRQRCRPPFIFGAIAPSEPVTPKAAVPAARFDPRKIFAQAMSISDKLVRRPDETPKGPALGFCFDAISSRRISPSGSKSLQQGDCRCALWCSR